MEIDILLKIFLAAVLGGVIGLERELSQKGAGLRSSILIAVGSTLLTVLSFKLGELSENADPTNLTAQIVIGIGLLGAGAIIRARFVTQGLTSAATIWLVAAIGIAVGSGYYLISLIVTVLILVLFIGLKHLSAFLENYAELYAYVISTEDRASVLIEVKKVIRELGLKYIDARLSKTTDGYEIEIALHTSSTKNEAFVEKIMQLHGVKEITSEHL